MEVQATSELVVADARVANFSGLPDAALVDSSDLRQVATQLSRWVNNARGATGRTSMFDRGAYIPPDNVYDEMRSARYAVANDDIVSGVASTTEAFAFAGIKWESEDADDADIFNQLSGDLDLDSVIRRMWRETFTYSCYYAADVWGWREYTVRGRSPGEEPPLVEVTDPTTGAVSYTEARNPKTNRPVKRGQGPKRKKRYRVWVPTEIRMLDAAKIVPLGVGPFGAQRYAWQATPGEIGYYQQVIDETKVDVLVADFFTGIYEPDYLEAAELVKLGVNPRRLLLLNPKRVSCHTLTKPDYQRHADVHLKSCFSLLDLKRQLMQADRAMLVGAANFLLLVRKGSKDEPATQGEIDNLKANYNFIAKLPVIISDHRLEIEIIAPKIDLTLQAEKYDVIDTRLLGRLLGALSLGGHGQRNETNVTLSYAVARGMENRRHMIRRAIERDLAKAVVEHPRNANVFDGEPNLVFTPRNISLGFDQAMTQALVALRTQKEISRETILETFGLDQPVEALRREIEEERYDHIFQTQVPFSSPQAAGPNGGPVAPGVAGGQGGRPVGGGTPKANPAKVKPKTPNGNTTTKGPR